MRFKSILRFEIRAFLKQGGCVAAFLALKSRLSVKNNIWCPNCSKRRGARVVGITVLGHRFFGVRVAQMHVVGVLPIKFIEHQT